MSALPPKCPRFYYDLWHDRSWINRRVDEVEIISSDATRTKSTFDLNIKRINEIADYHGIDRYERIAVPLFVQSRAPMLDIDIDLNGKSQSLAGTLPNASVASCICIYDILAQLNADSSDENFSLLYPPFYQWLVDCDNLKADKAIRLISSKIVDTTKTPTPILDRKRWSKLRDNFIVVVYLDRLDDCENAKLTCAFSTMYSNGEDDKEEDDKETTFFLKSVALSFKESFLPRYQDIPFESPAGQLGTGFEERYHLKFYVPDGLLITSLNIHENGSYFSDGSIRRPIFDHYRHAVGGCYCGACQRVDLLNCQIAHTPTYISIHDLTKMQPGGNGKSYHLRIGMEPDKRFKYPLLICCYMLMLYLFLARYVNWNGSDLATFSLTSAAFFVALPFLFRRYKEHDFTLKALRRGRLAIAFMVAACLTGGFFNHLVRKPECAHSSISAIDVMKIGNVADQFLERNEALRRSVSCVVELLGYAPWMTLFIVIIALTIFLVRSILWSNSLQCNLANQFRTINAEAKFRMSPIS